MFNDFQNIYVINQHSICLFSVILFTISLLLICSPVEIGKDVWRFFYFKTFFYSFPAMKVIRINCFCHAVLKVRKPGGAS